MAHVPEAKKPLSEKTCRFNWSMQHPITNCNYNTSRRESICKAALNQNLTRAFDLFDLTPADEISVADTYMKVLRKCCVDPLRPPDSSRLGTRYRVCSSSTRMSVKIRLAV